MVEVINIEQNSVKQKKKRTGFFVLLGIFILYLIAVVTTVAIIGTYKNKEKVGITGSGGTEGAYYYVEVAFYDLEVGKGSFQIKASDFVLETPFEDLTALFFEGGAKTYKIKRDKDVEFVKVMFKRTNSYDSFYFYDLEYKDEELDYYSTDSMGELITPVLAIETFFFIIIFSLAFVIIKNTGASKPFKQRCREINESVVKVLKERGFRSTKVFYMSSPRTGETNLEKMILCVDSNNHRFAFVDYSSRECVIANYADIVSYSVDEKSGVGVKQVSGTTLFNLPYTETESYDLCNKLQLVIVLDSEIKTNVVYDFVKSGIRTASNTYKEMHKTLIDVSATLEIATGGASSKENKLFVRCKYCGVKNKVDASHCGSCGAVLD